jgi:hypothetical protein
MKVGRARKTAPSDHATELARHAQDRTFRSSSEGVMPRKTVLSGHAMQAI